MPFLPFTKEVVSGLFGGICRIGAAIPAPLELARPRFGVWSDTGSFTGSRFTSYRRSHGRLPLSKAPAGEFKAQNPLDYLVRADTVFRSLFEGGGEHRATLALLAEAQQRTGSLQSYRACEATLQNLQSYNAEDATTAIKELMSLSLARAKALWYGGDAKAALAVSDHMLLDVESGPVGLTPLQEASARTGQALG